MHINNYNCLFVLCLQFYPVARPFEVDKDVVERFKNSPLVTVKEVKASAKKRRVSIQGVVTEVSNVVISAICCVHIFVKGICL